MPSQEFIKGPCLSSSAAGSRLLRTKSVLRKTKSCGASLELKKVWFDTVEIKYHKIILGDNPAVSEGAPITIHWKAYDQEIIDKDDFEIRQKLIAQERNNNKKNSKSSSSLAAASSSSTSSSAVTGKSSSSSSSSSSSLSLDTNALWSLIDKERDCRKLKMDVQERAKILLRSGYSIRDIAKRTHEVQEIQRERIKSATSTKWDGINFALESSGRALRRLTKLELGGGGSGTGTGSSNNGTPRNGRVQNPAA